MAILGQKQFVERLEFFDGQRLFATDLDSLDRLHQEIRRQVVDAVVAAVFEDFQRDALAGAR